MIKTTLIQERCANPMESLTRFQNNADPNRVPIVLVPDDRYYCSCTVTVPSGVYCIQHRFGDDTDEKSLASPGLQCLPSWYRIAYCVSPQSCTYNAPVKHCPTSDNVMVNCDLTLVFLIGPSPIDVKHFVYNLGANRFNEFLSAATEEGIRQLVRQTPHHKVYELRGGNLVRNMLEELNEKFKKFGVSFTKAAITDVQLGKDLAHTLQATTEFESKIKEQEKRHDHHVKVIDFDAAQKLEELKKFNDRKLQDLTAARERALINREQAEINATNSLMIAATKAKETASVNETRAQSEAAVTQFQGKKSVEDMMAKAKAKSEERKIRADRDCENKQYEAEQTMHASKDFADALRTQAEAEGKAAESLKIMREHQLEMGKMEVLEALSRNGKIVISGPNGDRLINSLCHDSVLGKISLKA